MTEKVSRIPLIVNYDKGIKRAIAEGEYRLINREINIEDFPIRVQETFGNGKIEVVASLFNFENNINSRPAIKEMKKVGYRPAIPLELLALGAIYPELQKEMTIIGLGEPICVNKIYPRVLSLDVLTNFRRLDLLYFNYVWSPQDYFLGILEE